MSFLEKAISNVDVGVMKERSIVKTLLDLRNGCYSLGGRREVGKSVVLQQVKNHVNGIVLDWEVCVNLCVDSKSGYTTFNKYIKEFSNNYHYILIDNVSVMSDRRYKELVKILKELSKTNVIILCGSCKGYVEKLNNKVCRGRNYVLFDLSYYEYCTWLNKKPSMKSYTEWTLNPMKPIRPVEHKAGLAALTSMHRLYNSITSPDGSYYNKWYTPLDKYGNFITMYVKCAGVLSLNRWKILCNTPKEAKGNDTSIPILLRGYLLDNYGEDEVMLFNSVVRFFENKDDILSNDDLVKFRTATKNMLINNGLAVELDYNYSYTDDYSKHVVTNPKSSKLDILEEWKDDTEIMVTSPWLIRSFLGKQTDPVPVSDYRNLLESKGVKQRFKNMANSYRNKSNKKNYKDDSTLVTMKSNCMLEYYTTLTLLSAGLQCRKNKIGHEIDVISIPMRMDDLCISIECKDRPYKNLEKKYLEKLVDYMYERNIDYKFVTTTDEKFRSLSDTDYKPEYNKPCYVVNIADLLYWIGSEPTLTKENLDLFISFEFNYDRIMNYKKELKKASKRELNKYLVSDKAREVFNNDVIVGYKQLTFAGF